MSDPTPDERAQRISTLFTDAAELPPAERAAFLDTTCEGDAVLRKEIVSLLKYMDETGGLIDNLADKGMEEALNSLVGDGSSLDGLVKELSADAEKSPDPLVGQTVSHFTIIERIGAGGMGVVYKARDTRLEREVALKFLPQYIAADEEAKQRFVNEARAASSIDHPNIGAVYEVGDTEDGRSFIAMAYYKGRTLKEIMENGPVPVEKALHIIKQVAAGLSAAHAKGLIHRDIKPANVMLAENGVVKILDFGIAKLSGAETLTRLGSTAGTAAYMSPEQTRGETVDTRTDIWSLGVLLYELLSGKRPFQGDNIAVTINVVQQSEPVPISTLRPDADPAVSHLISGCLVKQADKRYQSMADFITDFDLVVSGEKPRASATSHKGTRGKRIEKPAVLFALLAIAIGVVGWFLYSGSESNPALQREKSIAVLPLENLSPDPDDAYFAAGIHEEILTNLANIRELRVIESASVRQFRETAKTLREVGEMLGVNYLLQGSAQRDGGRVAVAVRLIDAQEEGHLWGKSYDREWEDAISLRGDIARDVAEELQAILTPEELSKVERRPTENQEAYDLYLLSSVTGRPERIAVLERATRLDPDFYEAWDRLAQWNAYEYRWWSGASDRAYLDATRKALSELRRLEPDSERTFRRQGVVAFLIEDDLDKALDYALRAQTVGLGNSQVGLFYTMKGKLEEAKFHFLNALKSNPLNKYLHNRMFFNYLHLKDWEEASGVLDRVEDVLDLEQENYRQLLLYLQYGNLTEYITKISDGIEPLDGAGGIWLALANRDHFKASEEISKRRLGWLYMLSEANPSYDRGLRIAPNSLLAALNWFALGKKDEWQTEAAIARDLLESRAAQSDLVDPSDSSLLAICYALEGNREKVESLILEARELASDEGRRFRYQALCEMHIAIAYTVLGEYEEAIATLEAASRLHSPLAVEREAAIWFVFDPLRGNPRFDVLIGEMAALASNQRTYTKSAEPSLSNEKSIAILPFENISGQQADEPYVNGIHRTLLTQVSQIRGVRSTSSASVLFYKGTNKRLPQIASELQVANILQGNVQILGENMRINVELIDGPTDSIVWSRSYHRPFSVEDIYNIQGEIAKTIAESLHVAISGEEENRLEKKPTGNVAALKLYFRAQYMLDTKSRTGWADAIRLFQEAIELDPDFALAYAGLSRAYERGPPLSDPNRSGWRETYQSLAEAATSRALELDETLPEAYLARGENLIQFKRNFAGAKESFERALELNPNHVPSILALGQIEATPMNSDQRALGQWRISPESYEKAFNLDPKNPELHLLRGNWLVAEGQLEEARSAYELAVDIDPEYSNGYGRMGDLFAYYTGRLDLAIIQYRRAFAIDPAKGDFSNKLFHCYAWLGGRSDPLEAVFWGEPRISYAAENWRNSYRAEAQYYAMDSLDEWAEAHGAISWPMFANLHRRALLNHDIRAERYERALERYRRSPFRQLFEKEPQFRYHEERLMLMELAEIYFKSGDREQGERKLNLAWDWLSSRPRMSVNYRGNSGYGITNVSRYALLGQKEEAINVLREAIDTGYRNRWELESSALDSIREEPEFKAIMEYVEADWARQLANVRQMEANGELAPLPEGLNIDLETPASVLIEN